MYTIFVLNVMSINPNVSPMAVLRNIRRASKLWVKCLKITKMMRKMPIDHQNYEIKWYQKITQVMKTMWEDHLNYEEMSEDHQNYDLSSGDHDYLYKNDGLKVVESTDRQYHQCSHDLYLC